MITADDLRGLLDYDSHTGIFTWRTSPSRNIKIGDVAGGVQNRGYCRIRIHRRDYLAHRLAWLHVYGKWPPSEIDHSNGDKTDNRISNLRVATHSQNLANIRPHRDNACGVKGVRWHKRDRKWVAQIRVAGRERHLGNFECLRDAAEAYERAAIKYFQHFARVS